MIAQLYQAYFCR